MGKSRPRHRTLDKDRALGDPVLTAVAIGLSAALTHAGGWDEGCRLSDAVGAWMRALGSSAVFAAYFVAMSALLPGVLDAVILIGFLLVRQFAREFLTAGRDVVLKLLDLPVQLLVPESVDTGNPAATVLRTLASIGL